MDKEENKKIALKSLAKITRQCRGSKSQFIFGAEYGITNSIISTIETEKRDPQYTTFLKLAGACNLKAWQLMKLIEEDFPENFSMAD